MRREGRANLHEERVLEDPLDRDMQEVTEREPLL